ncbi:MAG: SpoIIE family protein phosphatase, partial [Bacteroidales bacterium]
MDKKENLFIEIAHHHENKHGKVVCGDTFLSRKISGDNRYVAVLSDGLGSGIKASVLSTMTASMAMNFRLRREPVLRSALNIMNALPIDSVRNINYATFTIVDTDFEGMTQILEFDSPDYLLFRDQEKTTPIRKAIGIDREGQ